MIRAPINQPSATRNPPTHNPQSAITAYNASKQTDPLIPTFFCRFALTIGHELRHEVGPLPALALRERRPGLRSEKRRTPSRPVHQATYQATYERGMRAEESSVISPTSHHSTNVRMHSPSLPSFRTCPPRRTFPTLLHPSRILLVGNNSYTHRNSLHPPRS